MDAIHSYASDDNSTDDDPEADQEDVSHSFPPNIHQQQQHLNQSSESHSPNQIGGTIQLQSVAQKSTLAAAPEISLLAGQGHTFVNTNTLSEQNHRMNNTTTKQGDLILFNNPTKDVMYQPTFGPRRDELDLSRASQRHGAISEARLGLDESVFHTERMNFARDGKALAPTTSAASNAFARYPPGEGSAHEVVRTTLGYSRARLEAFVQQDEDHRKRPRPMNRGRNSKEKDTLVYGSDDEIEYGIWAPPGEEEQWEIDNNISDVARGGIESLAPEQRAEREYLAEQLRQRGILEEKKNDETTIDRLLERKMKHLLPPKLQSETPIQASTLFHFKEEIDYRGRSWIAPPPGLGGIDADHKCFVPKKCIHRFSGSNKGIHRIRLFPITGHLILSAGLDGTCKVWSIEHKTLMRTYVGHSAAVRDVEFSSDGTKFISASFDRFLRLWNTENGEVLQTFTNRKVPYCVKFYPADDNLFVVGCSDNKIVCYDATTGAITQEYNNHLGPVNAILFVEDQGIKMISSSDDKKILVWEWDIGVPVKIISDPTMHSMPCLALHPVQGFFCGQSLDNTIAVFQASGRFALQRKKKFSGHIVSGYACEVTFSTDGQYLLSGDGNGNLWIWDWKRHKILQKLKAHSGGPTISCAWHPLKPSTVFTCGWDGVIKMWQ